jgi:hypothetical protein
MRRSWTLVLLVTCLVAWTARRVDAQTPDEPPENEDKVDVFGFGVPQNERLKISGLLMGAWTHDGAQAQLGYEKQARIGQATITLSGRITPRVRYLASFNPVDEVAARPACGEADFFFPNDPRIYTAGPNVPCDPEEGNKRVDSYNTYALDSVNQQGPLREGYVDFGFTRHVSFRLGRFILPIGFPPADVGSWSAKDMTRIQRLNTEANFGAMIALATYGSPTATQPRFEAAILAVSGDGHRQHDYNWFYFADGSLDTNSAVTGVVSVRARPHERVDLRAAYKKGFTGSKLERLPSYWASKRRNDALVVGARLQLHPWAAVFGEYARYVWGPTDTSAELVGVDPGAIEKPGYYVGGTFEVPLTPLARVGVTVTREEISRDDSLVKFLAGEALYGVELGRQDRGTIARLYVDVMRLVTVGLFWADISNPYPWISGSWPVSGPRAFTGRAPDRYGLSLMVRTP